MTSQTPPPEFRTAIADIVTAAMAYGAMLGINGRDRIEELLRADLSQSLGDALAPEVENLLDIRPSLAEADAPAACIRQYREKGLTGAASDPTLCTLDPLATSVTVRGDAVVDILDCTDAWKDAL